MTDEKGILHLRRVRHRYDSVVQESVGAFGWYQLRLLLITQLPYVSITGSLVCTLYDNIVPSNLCDSSGGSNVQSYSSISNSSDPILLKNSSPTADFHSLIMELGLACRGRYVPTLMTTGVMGGGVFGAGIFGFIADRYGRKFACVFALLGCCLANLLLLISVQLHWAVGALVLFLLGIFGGGYMVVNVVLLLENVGKAWRLFCSSMNGWPLGLMVMALIGYVSRRWDYYHLTLAILCIPLVAAYYYVYESPRWLMQHGRMREAEEILHEFSRINCRPPISQSTLLAKAAESGAALEDCNQNARVLLESSEDLRHQPSTPARKYTYMDLVRVRPVFLRLAALSYCWFAASMISFGIYFNMEKLAGNRYLNTFLTGMFKGAMGVLPWLLSRWLGRKPILTVSSCITCFSVWAAVVIFFISPSNAHSPVLTAFVILGASWIDPMWKINHLYSAELFPTVVRNMARAVCNIGSRLGSLIAPQIAYLSAVYFPLPFIIYGSVSVVEVVVAFLLPETKGKSLPDRLPSLRNSERRAPKEAGAVGSEANIVLVSNGANVA